MVWGRTIGELLSRGDDTSMLDSSSGTSPYILPSQIESAELSQLGDKTECNQCSKWNCTFFQSAHFLGIIFHLLIEHRWYFRWTHICPEWYFGRLNWNGCSLLSHSLMCLSFAIHFVIAIETAPILLFRWAWLAVWFWIFCNWTTKNVLEKTF